jgi:hypothetical protein
MLPHAEAILILCGFVGAYFLPTLIALWHGVPGLGAILVLNIVGWTIVAWFVALFFATRDRAWYERALAPEPSHRPITITVTIALHAAEGGLQNGRP